MLTNEQCIKMLSEYNVPISVQRHSMLVAQAAVYIAEMLNSKGYQLDLDMIEAAALLHDIARTQPDHAEAGAELLSQKGCLKLAEIVRHHMKPGEEVQDSISEIIIVYLADKLVEEDQIVTLEQRFLKKKNYFMMIRQQYSQLKKIIRLYGKYKSWWKTQSDAGSTFLSFYNKK